MISDLYLLLNLSRDATAEQIEQAFRAVSMHYHPVHTTPDAHERFTQIQQAYHTLRNPLSRSKYDLQLRQLEQETPEPLLHSRYGQGAHLFESFYTHHPSIERLAEVLLQNFTQKAVPKSKPVHDVNLELVFSPAEARSGGTFPLQIPVPQVCRRCNGTGRAGLFICDRCEGIGTKWTAQQLDIIIPAGTRDGTVIPLSLRPLGIRNLYLNLHIRVAERWVH